MSFGGSIKLTGEAEYKRALESIKRELKEVGAQMRLTAAQYKNGSDSMEALNAKSKVLESTLKLQEKRISTLKNKQKELSEIYAKSAKSHESLKKEYENEVIKLKELEKTAGSTSAEYKKQKDVVEELAANLKKSTDEQDKAAKSMSGIRTELIKAETECQKTKNSISDLENEMGKAADETKRMESAYGKLKSTIESQEKKLGKLKDEYKNVVISQGENSDSAKKLGREISNLSGELKKNKDKMKEAEVASDKLDKSLDKVDKTAGNAARGGFTVLKGAIANLISSGISKLANVVKSKLGDAIWRVDTINSFVTTMQNLGYSAEDTQDSIEKLKAAAKGMPTTLPALAESQGQYAALLDDMVEATDLTVALSYATLAGSKSQEQANRALDQWYQIIANGKPNLTSWRIINKAMPAQLNQLAKSLLGADATSQDLFETWKEGKEITTGQVVKALIDLNKRGGGGLASFEKQARESTAGIQTSMQNIGNAISIGIADLVETIGSENIVAVLNDLRVLVGNTFKVIGEALKFVIDNKTEFITALGAIGSAILAYGAVTTAITLMANPIALTVAAIVGLTTGIVILWNKSEGFRNFWLGLWDNIKVTTKSVIDALVKWFTDTWDKIKSIWAAATEIFFKVCDAISGAAQKAIYSVSKWFMDSWNKIKDIWNQATGFFKGIWEGIKGIFSVAANWFGNIFGNATDKMKNAVTPWTGFFKNVWENIKNIFGSVSAWFGNIFGGAFNAIKRAFSGFGNFFGGLWDTIKNKFSSIGAAIADSIGGAFKAGINSVIRMVENTINRGIELLNGAIDLINMIPMVHIGKIGKLSLPKMAQGGVIENGARTVIAGESGAEAIVPLEKNIKWIRRVAAELRAGIGDNISQPGDNFNSMVSAFKTALGGMVVELDGEEAGRFVEKTVAAAIYG